MELFSEKKFHEEVVEAQHDTSVDDAMELCTINLNKDAVRSCESYQRKITINLCPNYLPVNQKFIM